jgi:hypothetical protein
MNFQPLTKYFLQIALACACAGGTAAASPLILAQPTSQTAFFGDVSVTFQVMATGSPAPAYQWQVKPALPPDSDFANISEATGAALILTNPDLGANGNQYRCVVTSGSSVQSAAATLNVYPAPPMSPPAATVSPASVVSNDAANITIQVTSLPSPGSTVRIERILDLNANGSVDIGEPVVQSFLVTDGQAAWFGTGSNDNSLNGMLGGIRNPNIPGDDDTGMMAMDGKVTTHISLPTSPESGRTAGSYLIRISSPTGAFPAFTKTLTVTQPTHGQIVSGQVTDGGAPVPWAVVTAVESDGDNHFVASTVADASGNYTLALPAGSYTLMSAETGYVAAMPAAPSFSLTVGQALTDQNPALTAATSTISGTVRDASNSTLLRGVQLYAESSNGDVAVTSSDADGNYVLPTVPGQWRIRTSQSSLAALGCLDLDEGFRAATTEGGTSALDIPLTAATAMVYGTVRDPLGNPMPGVAVEAGDDPYDDETDYEQQYDWTTFTNADGKYFIGVSSGVEWRFEVNQQPAIAPHVMPAHQWVTPAPGGATQLDFAVQAVTAHITGTVTKDGAPLAGIVVGVSSDTNDVELTTTTNSTGAFDLGVVADTWWIGLDDESLIYAHRPPVSIGNGQTIQNQNFEVLEPTGTISGLILDPFGNPFTDEDVYAYTDSGTYYEVFVEPAPDGSFSLPVLAGIEWWVGADGCDDDHAVTPQPDAFVTIIRSAMTEYPENQSGPLGQNATFSVTVDAPSPTIQWQRLPLGADWDSGWIDLTDNATFQGSDTPALTVLSPPASMSGDRFRCVVVFMFQGNPIVNTSDDARLTVVTAHIRGHVTVDGAPVEYLPIGAGNSQGHYLWIDDETNADGSFDLGISRDGTWYLNVPPWEASKRNLISPHSISLTVADSNDIDNITVPLLRATGNLTVTVVDENGNPIEDAYVDASSQYGSWNYFAFGTTGPDGRCSLPVTDGEWTVTVSVNSPEPYAQQTVTVSGSAVANFAPSAIVGHLQGTVTQNGNPVPYTTILAVPQDGNLADIVSATTDLNGNFDLGVSRGTWAIRISQSWANSLNVVGPSIYKTVVDSTPITISGIPYEVLTGTAPIYGNVRDASGNPVAGTNVWASTTINGVEYNSSCHTDATGTYYFPSLSGHTWWVDAAAAGYSGQQIAVNGPTEANFGPSPHSVWQSQFTPDDVATGRTTPTADFDRDGLPNLLEYAFRKNPKAPGTSGITPNVSANKMSISFPCDATCTDITYTVQASSNLSAWEDIAKSIRGAITIPVYDSQSNPLSMVSDTGTGLRTVTVADTSALGSRRFLRIAVSDPALPLPTPTPPPPPF